MTISVRTRNYVSSAVGDHSAAEELMRAAESGGGGGTVDLATGVTGLLADVHIASAAAWNAKQPAGSYLTAASPLAAANLTGTITTARLPTTGLTIGSHFGPVTTDADAGTITFDCALTDWHLVVLGGNRTLALAGDVDGQQVAIALRQDGTGSRLVTWWAGILWPSGVVPTLTTTANKIDVFTFKRLSTGAYLGFVAGKSH